MKKGLYPLIFILVVLVFFWKFFFQGLLPIPADTIVGMYHPWRDFLVQKYPNGIPFKNFLITDPVRQQYPWRQLAINLLKKKQLPLWNPYTFAGTPLLANLQSAVFYPFNIFFFLLDFDLVWSFLIILQPVLAGFFLYFYLRHFRLKKEACFLGAISFAFSGFFIAWLEWNTILHSVLWLPLILLSIEKVLFCFKSNKSSNLKAQSSKLCRQKSRASPTESRYSRLVESRRTSIKASGQLKTKNLILWTIVFIFSLICSFFAGHLQVFFYVFLISVIYTLARLFSLKKEKKKTILLFVIYYLLFTALSAVQWLPTLKLISLSARELNQISWQKEGWFIPWQHLIQFFAPDFFGNPATLNYWGAWNYGEFVGYIGILPLIMAFLAMIWRKDKKTLFFGTFFFLSLIFALPTWLAKLPYQLKIPFLSTSQPTRFLFLTDFSLAILAALGFDFFLRKKIKTSQIIKLLMIFALIYSGLWIFVLIAGRWFNTNEWLVNLAVVKRNLILPTGLFFISAFVLMAFIKLKIVKMIQIILTVALLVIVVFDLFRFGWKFTPFTKKEYLFSSTKTIKFLKKDKEQFRFMTTDKRIFPANFTLIYKLQTVDGYDPLYSLNYGELMIASERKKPDISVPFGFNRIITLQNYESSLIDLLNVKYVLSFDDLNSEKLVKVFEEGKTKVYENQNAFPRAFLTRSIIKAESKQEAIEALFNQSTDLHQQAIVYDDISLDNTQLMFDEEVKITEYSENSVKLETNTRTKRLLVLTDNYYPDWKVFIDGEEDKIYQVDYNLRGVVVSSGKHKIRFDYSLQK